MSRTAGIDRNEEITLLSPCVLYCHTGAAIGPQLAGILSRSSWHNVFYMLIAAEFAALLVSTFCWLISAHLY